MRLQVRENVEILNELVTGEVFSEIVDMQVTEGIAFQVNWSGGTDISGEMTIECSVDGKSFCTFAGSNSTISGTSGGHIYDIVETHVRYLRVRVNVSSGSSVFKINTNRRTREI